jgi:hypothetical protein
MSDTPIYDRLRAEFLHVDPPAGDDHPPSEGVGTQPIVEPRHSKHEDACSVDDTCAARAHQGIDHDGNDTARCFPG